MGLYYICKDHIIHLFNCHIFLNVARILTSIFFSGPPVMHCDRKIERKGLKGHLKLKTGCFRLSYDKYGQSGFEILFRITTVSGLDL